jgi:DNA-binding XRE family transcriptional regulator
VLAVADDLGIPTTRSDGRRFLVRDFRPLGITAMARAGVQPNIIAHVVGHKSTRTTERYLRLSDADARRGQLALFTNMHTTRTKEEVLATIASNIKRLRATKGWSQVRCADRLGVTRQYWYQLEQDGKADVTVLIGVGRLFGVSLEELTGEAASEVVGA